jgi:hypothetical protein
MLNRRNKKAQVGDTVTWVVATIIIVVMIFFFVFGSSLLADTKSVQKFRNKLISPESVVKYDLMLSKSLYTYFKIDKEKEKISYYQDLEIMESKEIFQDDLEERKKEIQRGA